MLAEMATERTVEVESGNRDRRSMYVDFESFLKVAVRAKGLVAAVPSAANPPATVMRGRPECRTSLLPSTTPGSGRPAASVKIVAALNPRSLGVLSMVLREYPARVSFNNLGVKVWVSLMTKDRVAGVLALAPLSGVGPAVVAAP